MAFKYYQKTFFQIILRKCLNYLNELIGRINPKYKDEFSEHKHYLGKKIVYVQNAPNPSNILWPNIGEQQIHLNIRYIFSSMIYFTILTIATFIGIYLNNWKQQYTEKNPRIKCDIGLTQAQSLLKMESECLSTVKYGYTDCYCRKYTNDISKNFSNCGNKQVCLDWWFETAMINLIPILIVLSVTLINIFIRKIIDKLVLIEKHKYKSQELSAKVVKLFWGYFVNTGLIICLTNWRINQSGIGKTWQYITGGTLIDINIGWFQMVGSVLLFTMTSYIFSTPISFSISKLISKFFILMDQKFTCNKRITKKKKQKDYEALYAGQQFQLDFKYPMVMNIVFVCMFYSSGVPFLYLTTFLQLLLILYMDKYELLCLSRVPNPINSDIEDTMTSYLPKFFYIHMILSIYIFGSNITFYDDSQVNIFSGNQLSILNNQVESSSESLGFLRYYVQIFLYRCIQQRCLLQFFLLICFLIADFSRNFLIAFFYKIGSLFFNLDSIKTSENPLRKQQFYSFLSMDEILSDIHMIKEQIKYHKQFQNNSQENEQQSLINLLNLRLKDLKDELNKREQLAKQQQDNLNINLVISKFLGLFSYDIRHNPEYQQLFQLDNKVQDNSDIDLTYLKALDQKYKQEQISFENIQLQKHEEKVQQKIQKQQEIDKQKIQKQEEKQQNLK